jgi:cutinase
MHGAVSELSEAVKKQVVAGALFGDSMNGKHSGAIPKYPKENIIEVCNDGDGICSKRIQGITGKRTSPKLLSTAPLRTKKSVLEEIVDNSLSALLLGILIS